MRRASFLTKFIMSVLIVVLSATLIYTLLSYRNEQRERTEALKKQSEQGEVPAEVTAEGSMVYASEENREVQTDTAAQSADKAENSASQTSKEEAPENLPIAISCRGESWAPDGNDKEDGWPAILGSMLEENGVSAAVGGDTFPDAFRRCPRRDG